MDRIEEVIDELEVRNLGEFDGNVFLIEPETSDKFANIYTIISDM